MGWPFHSSGIEEGSIGHRDARWPRWFPKYWSCVKSALNFTVTREYRVLGNRGVERWLSGKKRTRPMELYDRSGTAVDRLQLSCVLTFRKSRRWMERQKWPINRVRESRKHPNTFYLPASFNVRAYKRSCDVHAEVFHNGVLSLLTLNILTTLSRMIYVSVPRSRTYYEFRAAVPNRNLNSELCNNLWLLGTVSVVT